MRSIKLAGTLTLAAAFGLFSLTTAPVSAQESVSFKSNQDLSNKDINYIVLQAGRYVWIYYIRGGEPQLYFPSDALDK